MSGLTSHEVRRLRVCCICQQIGIYQPTRAEVDVPTVVMVNSTREQASTVKNERQKSYCHPRCYIKRMGAAKLLGLHDSELNHIRMDDVPDYVMRRLMKRMTPRTPKEPST